MPHVIHDPGKPPLDAAARAPSTWCEVRQHGHDVFRVRLSGFFAPTWMSSLCCGISRARLSIERAHAVRAANGSWMSEHYLRVLDESDDPTELPYLKLAQAAYRDPGRRLALTRYALVQTDDHGGTLKLSFEAPDAVGLLGALLTALSDFSVYPVEMHVETRGGRAEDSLWLSAIDGGLPRPESEQAIRALLDSAAR
jgi:UTP:GlnB (protein PII) uridylyltransferase